MKSFLSMLKNSKITSIAIGKFDGVHIAHQKLFKELDKNACVLVISTISRQKQTDKRMIRYLCPLRVREQLIPYMTRLLPFESICNWNGEEFVRYIREKLPNLRKIVVGYDFRFGKNKSYGADDLKNLFNAEVAIVPEIKIQNIPLHSSIIKELIMFGDIALANKLLGWNYRIFGKVVSGQNLGSKELYPTINLKVNDFVLPGNGVYASFTQIKSEIFPSVSFVGNRLSTDRKFGIESHILDKNIILNQKSTEIIFIDKIRDNKRFESFLELKSQISSDILKAKKILKFKP